MPVMAHYISGNITVIHPYSSDYQGGYAVHLVGGIAPSSNVDFISKAGTPSREFLVNIFL
jgi:hypothetical protein